MEASFVIALCIVMALYVMIPKRYWRYMSGYVILFDVISSGYAIHMGVATGTVSGLAAGFIAAVGISVMLRTLRLRYGSLRLAINGDTSVPKVAGALLTQSVRWGRSLFKGIFTSGEVAVPDPMDWNWIETSRPHTWSEVLDHIWNRGFGEPPTQVATSS